MASDSLAAISLGSKWTAGASTLPLCLDSAMTIFPSMGRDLATEIPVDPMCVATEFDIELLMRDILSPGLNFPRAADRLRKGFQAVLG